MIRIHCVPSENAIAKAGRKPFYLHFNRVDSYKDFPGADHPTKEGPCQRPALAEFGDWQEWRGRWGATKGALARFTC